MGNSLDRAKKAKICLTQFRSYDRFDWFFVSQFAMLIKITKEPQWWKVRLSWKAAYANLRTAVSRKKKTFYVTVSTYIHLYKLYVYNVSTLRWI